jgi:hypothetical protein
MKKMLVLAALALALVGCTVALLTLLPHQAVAEGVCRGKPLAAVCLKQTAQNRSPPDWFERQRSMPPRRPRLAIATRKAAARAASLLTAGIHVRVTAGVELSIGCLGLQLFATYLHGCAIQKARF